MRFFILETNVPNKEEINCSYTRATTPGRPYRFMPDFAKICLFKTADNSLSRLAADSSLGEGNSLSQLTLTAPSEREPYALLAEEGGIF